MSFTMSKSMKSRKKKKKNNKKKMRNCWRKNFKNLRIYFSAVVAKG